jgi:ABC-2 type transport system permease protein
MDKVNRFVRHAWLSYKALFSWLNPQVYLFVMVINPLSQLLFFSILVRVVYDGEGLPGYVASNALLLCVMNSVFGIMTVVTSDRRMGTLQLVVASPANKGSLFLARSLFHILNGFFTAVLGFASGMLIFGLNISYQVFLPLIVVWIVSIFAACGLGLVIASFCLWSPSMHLWSNLLANLLLLLSSANYPRYVMPEWMTQISNLFPLTRGVEATKQLINVGDSSGVFILMGEEFLLGTLFFVIGILLIRYAEFLARVRGTLELD